MLSQACPVLLPAPPLHCAGELKNNVANLQRELNYIRRLQLTPDGNKPGELLCKGVLDWR